MDVWLHFLYFWTKLFLGEALPGFIFPSVKLLKLLTEFKGLVSKLQFTADALFCASNVKDLITTVESLINCLDLCFVHCPRCQTFSPANNND